MEYLTDRLIEIAYQEIQQEKLLHLHRHALIKAQAKEYVRQSQVRLILHPLAERLQAMWAKRRRSARSRASSPACAPSLHAKAAMQQAICSICCFSWRPI